MVRECDGLIFKAQALTRAWAMKTKQIDKIILECWECKDCMTLAEHIKRYKPLSTYYSLGWVELENDEFTTTSYGKQALADFTLIGGAKTFEEYAKKELSRRKKASKVKEEDEDAD